MSEMQGEQTFVSNVFGTVTSKRVIYNRAKGWLSGGSREDIPLKHVTSVRLDISRSVLAGVLFALIGFTMLVGADSGGWKFCGAILFFLAVLCFWGSPLVVVNTAGTDLSAAKGTPWQRHEAESFVETLRAQLFRE